MHSAWGADPQNLPPDEPVKSEPPRPLMRELPPADPYPIDALGHVLAPAARAIHDRVKAPVAIGAQSVSAPQRSPSKDMPISCCRSGGGCLARYRAT